MLPLTSGGTLGAMLIVPREGLQARTDAGEARAPIWGPVRLRR